MGNTNEPNLVTRVEFESRLSAKLKASFRTRPQEPPEKYYNLLSIPYIDSGPSYKKQTQKTQNENK